MSPDPAALSARVASPAELLDWAADPDAGRRFSALAGPGALLVDAGDAALEGTIVDRLARWLRQLPCPSIAIAAQPTALAAACDASVGSLDEAAPLLKGILQSPRAAAVLAQLLRLLPGMPLEDGLIAESMAYAMLQSGPEYQAWLAANRATAPLQPQDEGPAVVVEREGDILRLELNRPSNRNAMSMDVRDGLVEGLQLALADDSIRQIALSGRGKCFSTGGDLSEFGSTPDPVSGHLVRGLALPGRLLAQCAARAEARVHGACIGSGIEFPAFAQRVVSSADAHFQLPELRFGLIPGAGGCVSIARRIGRQRTAWLVLSGKRITARRALQWGLIDAVVD
jgi:enoyl-CoA hydratase